MLSMPAASSDPACCKLLPADMQIQLMLVCLSSSWLFADTVRILQYQLETAILLI